MNTKAIENEKNRLCDLLSRAKVPDEKREALAGVIDNLAWMRIRLDDTRNEIKDSKVCIPYDNGGGQSGIRENPLYKGYENLWKSYMVGLEKFSSYLPKEMEAEELNDSKNILSKVIRMKEGA